MSDLTIENLNFSYGESVVFENLNLNYNKKNWQDSFSTYDIGSENKRQASVDERRDYSF